MTYGYIRVSTGMQTVENQRFEVEKFCEARGLSVDEWCEETVSGTRDYEKRLLGGLLDKVQKGDLIICAELSRLGRSLFMIMNILSLCMDKGVQVWTIKDGYRLGDDITSKVLAFAFGLCAEIERDLISKRTKEALARKKAEGMTLGRPKGRKSSHTKLTGNEAEIALMLAGGESRVSIAKHFGVHRDTLAKFIRDHALDTLDEIDVEAAMAAIDGFDGKEADDGLRPAPEGSENRGDD